MTDPSPEDQAAQTAANQAAAEQAAQAAAPKNPQERIQERLDIATENRQFALQTHGLLMTQVKELEARINAFTGAMEQLTKSLAEDFKEGAETVIGDVEKVL